MICILPSPRPKLLTEGHRGYKTTLVRAYRQPFRHNLFWLAEAKFSPYICTALGHTFMTIAKTILLFNLALIGTITSLKAQVVVANWPNGKKAALSITFDDNCPGQFTHARPALDARGYKGTFFVITGGSQCGLRDWDTLRSVARAGHEIGSHSVTHPQLQTLDTARIGAELRDSHAEIQRQIPNLPTKLTIAWPSGRGGGSTRKEDTIRMIAGPYYLAGRSASSGQGWDSYTAYLNPFFKNYYLQVGTYLQGPSVTGAAFGQTIRACLNAGGLMSLLYHGIETGGFNNIPITLFEEHLDTLANHPDLWITTFGQMLRYHNQARQTTVTNVTSSNTYYGFTLADTLNATDYDETLTIKLDVASTGIVQTGNYDLDIDGQRTGYRYIGTSDTIIFNAKRGQRINLSTVVGLANRWSPNWTLSPMPAQGTLILRDNGGQSIPSGTYTLQDQLGRIVTEQQVQQSTNSVNLDVTDLPSGLYTLRIKSASGFYSNKVIVQK